MGDEQLEEGGRQWPTKFVDSGYQWDQLCMRRVIFLQVPTPKNNSVHNCKADLAAAEPEDDQPARATHPATLRDVSYHSSATPRASRRLDGRIELENLCAAWLTRFARLRNVRPSSIYP